MMMMMMMTMMSCFYGMVDQRKAFSLVSSRHHCQRSSPSRISDMPRAGFEPAENVSSGFVELSCAVVITTTLRFQAFGLMKMKKMSKIWFANNSLWKFWFTINGPSKIQCFSFYLFDFSNFKLLLSKVFMKFYYVAIILDL